MLHYVVVKKGIMFALSLLYVGRQDSSVGIVTDEESDGIQFPTDVSPLHCLQTGSGVHPAYQMGKTAGA
jgi:hypothetical protein